MQTMSKRRQIALHLCVAGVLILLVSCGGKQTENAAQQSKGKETTQSAAKAEQPAKLKKNYQSVTILPVDISTELASQYPQAAKECQNSAIAALKEKNAFRSVGVVVPKSKGKKGPEGLLVQTKVTDLRIVSDTARTWGGVFVGSSYMNLEATVIDVASKKVLDRRELSTANNPWAAEMTFGSTDRSLPNDMGKILAEYLASINPAP